MEKGASCPVLLAAGGVKWLNSFQNKRKPRGTSHAGTIVIPKTSKTTKTKEQLDNMSETQENLTVKVSKINPWRGKKTGFFFTTSEDDEFFMAGTPLFKEGQVVTLLIDRENKIKNAIHAEFLRVEETPSELAETFAGAKQTVTDAKTIVREAQKRMATKARTPSQELLDDWKAFQKLVIAEGESEKVEMLFLSYRLYLVERALIDFGFSRGG